MTWEALQDSLHLLAVLTLVVFGASQAALCRPEWLNAAVVQRLVRLDRVYWIVVLLLVLTGVIRMFWGVKGMQWYVTQPLFYAKVAIMVVMLLVAARSSLAMRRWAGAWQLAGSLPLPEAVLAVRRHILLHTHLLPVAAVVAVYWERGL